MRRPQARVRIDFSESVSIGPGKIGLLEQIERCGSLSAAARELKMSYRRAWLLLTNVNTSFSEPVAALSVGGVEGGGARLTPFGHRLVAEYREFQGRVDELVQKTFADVRPARASPGKSPPRRAIKRAVTGDAKS